MSQYKPKLISLGYPWDIIKRKPSNTDFLFTQKYRQSFLCLKTSHFATFREITGRRTCYLVSPNFYKL